MVRVGLLLLLLAAALGPASAQNRGQYLLGIGGLNAGTQAPVGITYVNLFTHYGARTAKDPSGKELPVSGHYAIDADQNLVFITTPWRLLGAHYGTAVDLVYAHGSLTLERFDASASGSGFGDIYVEPFNLGWHLPRADVRVAYGFVAPIGAQAVTSDYWGHEVVLASTFHLDQLKSKQLSINSVTEFHQCKRDTDLKVGNTTNLELGAGQILPLNQGRQLLQIGIVGYAEWQFTDDDGTATLPALARLRDRVFAVGGEVGVIVPKWKTSFLIRPELEFAARNRAEGSTVTAGVVKSF